ncbi:MAG: peptidoglycan synthetase [Bacteroidetes bacterium HGW-Bacteroidetes-12]|nr:MAG: peptidoglycan synthetase [Bacteroidetes bacterium HGW-Bacteroidetes-12]
MNIHFIAIGGAAMHNLAIALHLKGYNVSGSDDEIFEPSRSRLAKHNLLPENIGWCIDKIHPKLDAIILGMHARADNHELVKAKELEIPVFSYPEYLYEQSKDKIRIVIGGSHGKTTITSMILHVLNKLKIDSDYMVGAQLKGFETMVKLSKEAKYIVLEGDEYLSSPIDKRPKFHLYKPHIALISGIAWDHMNVFPSFENYIEQFRKFIRLIEDNGKLIWCNNDKTLKNLINEDFNKTTSFSYQIPNYNIKNGITYIKHNNKDIPIQVFGKHNLMNIEGAKLICEQIGISANKFYNAISSFKGASKRLELLYKNNETSIYKDFAHSPSKLKATINAVKEQYPERPLIACIELHTFSSLNKKFLPLYKDTMNKADIAIVYFNPETLKHKKLPPLSYKDIYNAFNNNKLEIFTDSKLLMKKLLSYNLKNKNLLLMSSGNYNGMDFCKFKN